MSENTSSGFDSLTDYGQLIRLEHLIRPFGAPSPQGEGLFAFFRYAALFTKTAMGFF